MTSMLDTPFVPYHWLRRGALACAGIAGMLLIERLIVGRLADARLRDIEAALTAAGVPVDIRQLQRPPLSDAVNAAFYLKQAFAGIDPKVDSPRSTNHEDDVLGPPHARRKLWFDLARSSEQANAPAFVLARQARGHRQADWGHVYKSPAINIMLPSLNSTRHLANTVGDGAELSFLDGDHAEGVERIRDVLHLAHATAADRPFLVTSLVALGVDALAVHTLAAHVGALRVGNAPGEASRDQVRALIDELLSDERDRQFADSIRNENLFGFDTVRSLQPPSWLLGPVFDAEVTRLGAVNLHAVAAADAANNRDRDARLVTLTAATNVLGGAPRTVFFASTRPGRPVTPTLLPSLGRAFATNARDAATRDAAAIMLALRMYALDHGGRWPATLESLVPDYLTAVPRNKLSADDAPYGYQLIPAGLPDGRDRPLLVFDATRPVTPTTAPTTAYDRANFIDLTSWSPATTIELVD